MTNYIEGNGGSSGGVLVVILVIIASLLCFILLVIFGIWARKQYRKHKAKRLHQQIDKHQLSVASHTAHTTTRGNLVGYGM